MGILETLFGPPNIEKLKAKRDVRGLTRALRHKDSALRAAAAEALGDLRESAAVPNLTPLLGNLDTGVSKAAAEALQHLRWEPEDEEGRVAFLVAAGNLDGLASLGSRVVRPLVELLKHQARESGDFVGGALGPQGVVVRRPESADARSSVVNALRMFGAEAVEPLLDAINDEDSAVQGHASWALAEIGEPALRPLVLRYLSEHSGWAEKGFPLNLNPAWNS